MKAFSLTVIAVVATLSAVATASADPPVQTETTQTVSVPNLANPYPVCTNYGYGFNGAVTFTVTRRSTLFYDDAGSLVKEIRHVQFDGLVHKSTDLDVSIPYAASFTVTLDYAAGTAIYTGLFRVSHPDGSGVIAMSAGRQVRTLSGVLEDFSGNYSPIEWEQAACAYLAAA
jgi:hypothetical protein